MEKASGLNGLSVIHAVSTSSGQDALMIVSTWSCGEGKEVGAAFPPGVHTYVFCVACPCPSTCKNSLVYSSTQTDCIILPAFLLPLAFFELTRWVGGAESAEGMDLFRGCAYLQQPPP